MGSADARVSRNYNSENHFTSSMKRLEWVYASYLKRVLKQNIGKPKRYVPWARSNSVQGI